MTLGTLFALASILYFPTPHLFKGLMSLAGPLDSLVLLVGHFFHIDACFLWTGLRYFMLIFIDSCSSLLLAQLVLNLLFVYRDCSAPTFHALISLTASTYIRCERSNRSNRVTWGPLQESCASNCRSSWSQSCSLRLQFCLLFLNIEVWLIVSSRSNNWAAQWFSSVSETHFH